MTKKIVNERVGSEPRGRKLAEVASGKPRMTYSRYIIYTLVRDSARRRQQWCYRSISCSSHDFSHRERPADDCSPGSGEYYILASVHYVTGERQSLVGRIRDWILRGWRNLNPHVLLGGRTQEIQWVSTTSSDRFRAFLLLFPKKPGIVSPYSVVLANAGNAFAKKLGGDGEETPLRLLVFLSGRHGSSPRSIVPASGPYARVCTHILNNYAPPCAAILQPVDLMSSSPLRFAPEYTVTTWLHVASRRHRA